MADYDGSSVGHVSNVAGPGSPPSFGQAPLTGDFTTRVPFDASSALSNATLALTAATQVGISGFLTDTFTGVDATTLTSHVGETGATWAINSATAGSFDIRSNRVRCVTSPVDYYASGLSSSPDYDAIGTFRVISVNVVGSQLGITGRYDTTTRSGYFLQLNAGTPGAHVWQLIRTDNGTQVVLGSFATTFVANTTYVGTLRQRGTSLTAIIDGIEQISVTDATYATVGTVGLRSGQAAGTATGVHLDSLAAVDLSVVTLGQSSATLSLSATTGIPLDASSSLASPALAVTATTQIPLTASSAVASATLALVPVYLPIDAASSVASPTLALSATSLISLTSAGQSSSTLAATATTQVPLVASSAVASPTLALKAQTTITLAAASASASPTLAVSAQTQIPLGAVAASASDSLAPNAPTQVPLVASSAVSSTTLALSATTRVALVATSASASATLALTAPALITLSASSVSSATLILAPTVVLTASAVGSTSLSLTAAKGLTATADALSSSSISLTAATSVPFDASAGTTLATVEISAETTIALIATAQVSATLLLSAETQIALSASALSSTTMVLIVALPGVVLIGPALGFTSATVAVSAQTDIPLVDSSGLVTSTLIIVVPVTLSLSPVEALCSAIFGFETPTLLSLSAIGQSSASLVFIYLAPGYTGTVETMVHSDVKVAVDPDTGQSTAIYISRSVFQPVTLRSVVKADTSRDVSLIKLTSGIFEALQVDGPWDVAEDADDLTLSSQQTLAQVTNRADLEDRLPISRALELNILSRAPK